MEVNGGGSQLKTWWRDELPEGDLALEQVRKVGETTVKNCYGSAIRKRMEKMDQVCEFLLHMVRDSKAAAHVFNSGGVRVQ
jgi:hypothetical protein